MIASKFKFIGLIVAAVASFTLATILDDLQKNKDDISACIVHFERTLDGIIDEFDNIAADSIVINDLITNKQQSVYFKSLLDKPFSFLLYQNGKLILWNNNQLVPPDFLINTINEGSNSIRLKNGIYEISKQVRQLDGEEISLIRLIQIKSIYEAENKYIHNQLNSVFSLPKYVDVSISPVEGAHEVKNKNGKPIFFVTADETVINASPNYMKIAFQLLGALFLFLASYSLALVLLPVIGSWWSFMLLIIIFLIARGYSLYFDFPPDWYDLDLFSPQLYASSYINRSLGDLAINAVLCFTLIWYLYKYLSVSMLRIKRPALRKVVGTGYIIVIFLCSHVIGFLIKSLHIDSKIPFDINDFLNLNNYSLLALLIVGLSLCALLLLVKKLFTEVVKAFVGLQRWGLLVFYGYILFTVFLVASGYGLVCFLSSLTLLLLFYISGRIVERSEPYFSLSNLITLLIIIAFFSSVHFYHYGKVNDLRERSTLARKVSIERDLVTEYLFRDIQEGIFSDLFIRNYFRNPFISTQEIIDRVQRKYFGGFFSKYDVRVFLLNQDGKVIRSGEDEYLDFLEDNLLENTLQTISDYLFYIPKPSGSYAYLSNLPIIYRGKVIGSVVMELTPKTYTQTNLYPELLLEEKYKPPELLDKYSFALYSNEILIKRGGSYPYQNVYDFDSLKTDVNVVTQDDLEHFIYRIDEKKLVVITSEKDELFEPISLFSFLFCIFLVFALSLIIIFNFAKWVSAVSVTGNLLSITYKEKIQYSMLLVIVFSFGIIGAVTIRHFYVDYNEYHHERLVRKAQAIRSAIEYILKSDNSIVGARNNDNDLVGSEENPINLASLSDIHAMDINIYSKEGRIMNTSQPEIFSKGLLSGVMHPLAYKDMVLANRSQFIQNEHIGVLEYLSIYAPIRNSNGELVAFLNLPYFAKEKELDKEISSLLVALINVYVLMLMFGGFFAYLLSDSITRSFAAISEKLKLVQLGKKNEPIEWEGNDEIGQLVAEYNKMIVELEKSALLLARSERETAWREMARQVAHEIKNPLTPMKLSIQHLQRAMINNDPKARELAQNVSKTLIEQIENLSHIATEFSSFAQMPRARNQPLNIVDVMHTVVDLFSKENNLTITYIKPDHEVLVNADKNQLLSVFNNLIKNAEQAIPMGREGEVEVEVKAESGNVVVSVKDNGVGISSDQEQKVFVPNFTTKSGGTGLGLALSRQIIENAKGSIWFESEQDKGTTFYIELPEYTA